MVTPLLMVIILTLPMALARWLPGLRRRSSPAAAAAIGLGLVFLFTASGHFAQAGAMTEMLPPWVPARPAIIFLTGVLEIAIAGALFWPGTRIRAGWAAIAVLMAFFPANVYAAFTRAGVGGHAWGPEYLLIRTPLQILLIAWAWRFVVSPQARGGGFGVRTGP